MKYGGRKKASKSMKAMPKAKGSATARKGNGGAMGGRMGGGYGGGMRGGMR